MLKPEASQAIEEFIRMIEDLDEENRQKATIRETNDRHEKVEGVQSEPLRMPVTRKPIAQRQKADTSDLFCLHCGSHEIARNGSVRGVPRLARKVSGPTMPMSPMRATVPNLNGTNIWKVWPVRTPCSSSPRNVISASPPPIPGGSRYSGLSCSQRKMSPSQE